jgi:hypothetical protein
MSTADSLLVEQLGRELAGANYLEAGLTVAELIDSNQKLNDAVNAGRDAIAWLVANDQANNIRLDALEAKVAHLEAAAEEYASPAETTTIGTASYSNVTGSSQPPNLQVAYDGTTRWASTGSSVLALQMRTDLLLCQQTTTYDPTTQTMILEAQIAPILFTTGGFMQGLGGTQKTFLVPGTTLQYIKDNVGYYEPLYGASSWGADHTSYLTGLLRGSAPGNYGCVLSRGTAGTLPSANVVVTERPSSFTWYAVTYGYEGSGGKVSEVRAVPVTLRLLSLSAADWGSLTASPPTPSAGLDLLTLVPNGVVVLAITYGSTGYGLDTTTQYGSYKSFNRTLLRTSATGTDSLWISSGVHATFYGNVYHSVNSTLTITTQSASHARTRAAPPPASAPANHPPPAISRASQVSTSESARNAIVGTLIDEGGVQAFTPQATPLLEAMSLVSGKAVDVEERNGFKFWDLATSAFNWFVDNSGTIATVVTTILALL